MRLAPQDLVQRISPHIAVDQQHLAVLMARQAQCQIRRDEALPLLRKSAAHQDRLQRADVAKLKYPRTKAAKLLNCGAAFEQRRQLSERQCPGPRYDLAEIERLSTHAPRGRLRIGFGDDWCLGEDG